MITNKCSPMCKRTIIQPTVLDVINVFKFVIQKSGAADGFKTWHKTTNVLEKGETKLEAVCIHAPREAKNH